MRSRPTYLIAAALVAGALTLAGCAASGGSPQATPVTGTWQSTDTGEPFLVFKDDGTYRGSDGCNRLGGKYQQDGEIVRLDPGISTLMACPGVDTWLHKAKTVIVGPDKLEVHDKTDAVIGTLAPTETAGN